MSASLGLGGKGSQQVFSGKNILATDVAARIVDINKFDGLTVNKQKNVLRICELT
jgi:hypothetical protein